MELKVERGQEQLRGQAQRLWLEQELDLWLKEQLMKWQGQTLEENWKDQGDWKDQEGGGCHQLQAEQWRLFPCQGSQP